MRRAGLLFVPVGTAIVGMGAGIALHGSVWAGGLVGMTLGLVVSTMAGQRRDISSLEEIVAALEQFAAGRGVRLSPSPRDEDRYVQRVNRALDAIAERLSEGFQKEMRLGSLLDNLDVGVVLLDRRLHIELLNFKAEEIFHARAQEARGQYYLTLDGVLPLEGVLQDALVKGISGRREITPRPEVTLDVRVSPFPDAGGVLLLVRDVTQLVNAQRLRSELVANISHELKTPVTGLLGFAETLLEPGIAPEQQRHFLTIIRREAERLSHLVDDLLDLASLEQKREEPQLSSVDLETVVRSAAQRLEHRFARKGLELRVDAQPVRVVTDPERVEEILMNFLDNALKYTPKGCGVDMTLWPRGEGAVIEVHDEGPGIPQGDLAHVFERFYRVDRARSRASGGTGLGLSIAKHLAESIGGWVSADSVLEEGSTFRLTLGAAPGQSVSGEDRG